MNKLLTFGIYFYVNFQQNTVSTDHTSCLMFYIKSHKTEFSLCMLHNQSSNWQA